MPASARFGRLTLGQVQWDAPGVVLQATPYGEGDAVVLLLTSEHGCYRGLVRGGSSRRQRSAWDIGNIVQARWAARTSEQLGTFTGELLDAPLTRVLDSPLLLATVLAACATAAGALPERVMANETYTALVLLLARLVNGDPPFVALVRWELALLRELGFGLDLTRCAITGAEGELAFVSPRSGRAVAATAAGSWESRLLPLPRFLVDEEQNDATRDDLLAGLRLTGHFLSRDAFGQRHQAMPSARARLVDMMVSGVPL